MYQENDDMLEVNDFDEDIRRPEVWHTDFVLVSI